MTDPVASGALVIMAALVAPTYFIRIDLLGALYSLALRETVQHGLVDAGAFMLTLNAVLVAGQFSQHAESLAFGQVAISYFEKYGGTALACPTYKVMASVSLPSSSSIEHGTDSLTRIAHLRLVHSYP